MLAAIDSYFEFMTAGLKTVNPARKVIGIADAMDWPPKGVQLESFYLLVLGERGITQKSFWSSAVPVIVHTLQWTWIITGSDLTQGKIGRSRGDRYRTNITMREELLKATQSAWFAQKQDWAIVGNTPSGLVLTQTPKSPVEFFWWTPLTFLNRIDRESGVVYGAATVQVTDMTPELKGH
jgi:hypothetical protein